jgi:amino acid adenylation domain-containing protein
MLERKGVMPGIIVAIMVERSLEMIVGILGILKTGAAYLPIDPDYPEERIKYMLKDSNARILLKKSEIRKPKFETNPNDPNSNDQNKRAAVTVLDLEYLNFEFVSNFEFRASNFVSANLAYIIYTSGSTGNPKAVMIRQKSLINLLFALNDAYPFLARDSYPLKTSFLFDVSISELFGWFLGGGRLVGLEKDAEADPLRIIEVIKNYQITHINFVPSMFNLFVDSLNPETCRKLRSLRYIFLAGEALLPEVVRKFKRLNTGIRLENLYGPTEAAVYASKYSVRDWDDSPVIPIGRPMKNVKLYILDQDVGLRPIGVPGELVISGDGLAIGYLNRVELTAEKFDHDLWDLQDYQLIKNYKLQNTNYKQITNHKLQITNKPVHELPPTGATSNKKFLRGGPGGR